MGRGAVSGKSLLAVGLASGALLVVPAFPAMGGRHLVAVPLGFVGVQAAMLLWAARRWAPRPPESRASLRAAWTAGAIAAALLSLVATIPIALALLAGGTGRARVLLVYPAYFAGLLAAATLYWLLQRIAHLAFGRYLVGFLGGACLYGAVAPVAILLRGEPLNLAMMLAVAAVAGGLVGPAVAFDLA